MNAETKIKNKVSLMCILVLSLGLTLMASDSEALTTVDVQNVVKKTADKVLSYPEMPDYKVSATSTMHEMDKNWKSKKKTVVEKTIMMKNKIRSESIKSAVEIQKGKTKDVTQKFVNDAYKAREKAARERKKAKDEDGEDDEHRRRMDISLEEMLPFSEKNRENYEFALLEESTWQGTPVYVLEARAKQRTKDFFEGEFYIAKETFDIHRAELQLAKNPGPLKLMEMAVDFQVLPEGFLVLKKMSFRIHVGLVVKNIRREGTEEYFDYQFLE